MTWSANNPLPTVQVLLDDVNNGSTWPYDITGYVRYEKQIAIQQGKSDELSSTQPGTLKLSLDNTDGRFTLGSTSGSYGAINIGRGIRVKVNGADRFLGFVDSWITSWPNGGDNYAVTAIIASDYLARASRSPLPSALQGEYKLQGATAIYMLATDLTDALGGSAAVPRDPSKLTFKQDSGLYDTTGVNIAHFNAPSTTAPSQAQSDVSITLPAITGATAASVFMTGVTWGPIISGWIDETCILQVTLSNGATFFLYVGGQDGALFAWDSVAMTFDRIGGAYLDGNPHMFAIEIVSTTAYLYADGNLMGTYALSAALPAAPRFRVGGPQRNYQVSGVPKSVFTGAAVFNSPTHASFASILTTLYGAGVAGMVPGQRTAAGLLSRVLTYANMGASLNNLTITGAAVEQQVLTWPQMNGTNAGAVIDAVAQSEQGRLWCSAGKVYWSRRDNEWVNTMVTLDAFALDTGQQVQADTQAFTNNVQVSGPSYSNITAADTTSPTSISNVGIYGTSFNSLQTYADDALLAAKYRLKTHGVGATRVGTILVDAMTYAQGTAWATLWGLIPGSWLRVVNLPSQAVSGSTSLDLIVEGWTETYSATEFTFSINASPRSATVASYLPWILGNATYSVLGTTTIPAF